MWISFHIVVAVFRRIYLAYNGSLEGFKEQLHLDPVLRATTLPDYVCAFYVHREFIYFLYFFFLLQQWFSHVLSSFIIYSFKKKDKSTIENMVTSWLFKEVGGIVPLSLRSRPAMRDTATSASKKHYVTSHRLQKPKSSWIVNERKDKYRSCMKSTKKWQKTKSEESRGRKGKKWKAIFLAYGSILKVKGKFPEVSRFPCSFCRSSISDWKSEIKYLQNNNNKKKSHSTPRHRKQNESLQFSPGDNKEKKQKKENLITSRLEGEKKNAWEWIQQLVKDG